MMSGFRGNNPKDHEKECYILQTWVPNPEGLIRVIEHGLANGYNFTMLVGEPDSDFIQERYKRMFPKTPNEDVSNEADHSILRVIRSLNIKDLKEENVRVFRYKTSTGMCIYKIGAFAWISFFLDRKSAVLSPQFCVDATSSNRIYDAAREHYSSLLDSASRVSYEYLFPDDPNIDPTEDNIIVEDKKTDSG